MLNPHFIMHCLNVDAQINLEIMNHLVMQYNSSKVVTQEEGSQPVHKIIHNFKVNLTTHIQTDHDKMRI